MAHYRMQDRLPSAIVTANGSEKKMYEGNTVFFNKGDNFELRFFNPLREKIGVEIIFNGQKKSDGLLVLNPGEDIKLDRFLDDKKKMVFDTYHIDSKNSTAVEAAELNGDVTINFYKEKQNWGNWSAQYNTTNTNSKLYSSNVDINNSGYEGIIGDSGVSGNIGYTNVNLTNTNTTTSDYSLDNGEISQQKEYYSSNVSNVDITSDSFSVNDDFTESIETGRVEKGEISNQNLNTIDIKFESTPFHTIDINMKPTSTKSYTTATEIRNYCNQCGYRIRKNTWVFCPKCGNKLI